MRQGGHLVQGRVNDSQLHVGVTVGTKETDGWEGCLGNCRMLLDTQGDHQYLMWQFREWMVVQVKRLQKAESQEERGKSVSGLLNFKHPGNIQMELFDSQLVGYTRKSSGQQIEIWKLLVCVFHFFFHYYLSIRSLYSKKEKKGGRWEGTKGRRIKRKKREEEEGRIPAFYNPVPPGCHPPLLWLLASPPLL